MSKTRILCAQIPEELHAKVRDEKTLEQWEAEQAANMAGEELEGEAE